MATKPPTRQPSNPRCWPPPTDGYRILSPQFPRIPVTSATRCGVTRHKLSGVIIRGASPSKNNILPPPFPHCRSILRVKQCHIPSPNDSLQVFMVLNHSPFFYRWYITQISQSHHFYRSLNDTMVASPQRFGHDTGALEAQGAEADSWSPWRAILSTELVEAMRKTCG